MNARPPYKPPFPELLTTATCDAEHHAVIDFVASFFGRNAVGPTRQEIAEGLRVDEGTIKNRIARLERSGYLARTGNFRRSLHVATEEERRAALVSYWRAKLLDLSTEERRAAMAAAVELAVSHDPESAASIVPPPPESSSELPPATDTDGSIEEVAP